MHVNKMDVHLRVNLLEQSAHSTATAIPTVEYLTDFHRPLDCHGSSMREHAQKKAAPGLSKTMHIQTFRRICPLYEPP
jgi:hypothetical protein